MLSAATWATGFDLAQESEVIVPAVSVRCEQLAKHNRKRQRGFRFRPHGLSGVDAQGVRVTHRRKHTNSAWTDCRVLAQIQTVVEVPAPVAPKAVDCLEVDYARERATEASVEDRGSIPRAYTRSGEHEKSTRCVTGNGDADSRDLSESARFQRRKPADLAHSARGSDLHSLGANRSLRTTHQKADPRPNGGDGAIRRAVWRSLVARCGNAEVARSNRVTAPSLKTENSAQRLGSAGRHALEGGSPSGSTASGQSPAVQPAAFNRGVRS